MEPGSGLRASEVIERSRREEQMSADVHGNVDVRCPNQGLAARVASMRGLGAKHISGV